MRKNVKSLHAKVFNNSSFYSNLEVKNEVLFDTEKGSEKQRTAAALRSVRLRTSCTLRAPRAAFLRHTAHTVRKILESQGNSPEGLCRPELRGIDINSSDL